MIALECWNAKLADIKPYPPISVKAKYGILLFFPPAGDFDGMEMCEKNSNQ